MDVSKCSKIIAFLKGQNVGYWLHRLRFHNMNYQLKFSKFSSVQFRNYIYHRHIRLYCRIKFFSKWKLNFSWTDIFRNSNFVFILIYNLYCRFRRRTKRLSSRFLLSFSDIVSLQLLNKSILRYYKYNFEWILLLLFNLCSADRLIARLAINKFDLFYTDLK